MTTAEIEAMGAALPRGGAAESCLSSTCGARGLKRAIRGAGGGPLEDQVLTPESVGAMEPQLAATAEAVRSNES